ncbi:hypothetical protein X975_05211, partial [Stegodyphus mimosarum]
MWNGIAWDVKQEAASFLYTEVGKYEWIKISSLAAHLRDAPQHVRSYMKKYHHKDYFEEFLNTYDNLFYIENGRVAQYQDSFDIGYEEAVTYCENILATYVEPVDIQRFRGHLENSRP